MNKEPQEIQQLLIDLNACSEAIEWAKDKSWKEIYETCHRGDWLLWLFARTNPDDLQLLTLAKGHCANTVRHLMKDKRSTDAVDAAISFGLGEITLTQLTEFRIAAYAAAVDAYAAAVDAYAAAVDAYASAYAASASAASASAVDAASASAYAAYAYAAYAYAAVAVNADVDARKQNQQLTADIVRKHLPIELWNISPKKSS